MSTARWWCSHLDDEQYQAAKSAVQDAPPLDDAAFAGLRALILSSKGERSSARSTDVESPPEAGAA